MKLENYLNKLAFIQNEIRNYQAEQQIINKNRQEIKESQLAEEKRVQLLASLANRSNQIYITIKTLENEEKLLHKRAHLERLLEINYGSLVKELQCLATKKNFSVDFSNNIDKNNLTLGININTKDSNRHYGITLPMGDKGLEVFTENLQMNPSKLSINIDPNNYIMTNNTIKEAIYNCAKREEKSLENTK